MIGGGIALATLGALAAGTSVALDAKNIPECPRPTEANPCIAAWIGIAGGGLVLTSVGVPLYVYGMAKVNPDERPRSVEMMVTGSLAAGFGMVAVGGGVTTLAVGDAVGWWPFVLGSVGVVGGTVLAVYGAWEVPDVPEPSEERGLVVPEVLVGPTGGALRWHF
jgi:hypothetical protein